MTAGDRAAITEICRRLDGLPLAIELAAARTPLLDPEELNGRLGRALETLGAGPRDAPARQRTLRATIEWSYRLLRPEEARAFVRFAVFQGGATIEAAEHVIDADLDTLNALVDKHLLVRRQSDILGVRLFMLETVREYAADLLQGEELATTRERHCQYYLDLAGRAEPELYTHGEAEWLPRLDAEIDNLRAVLDWSRDVGNPVLALRLVGAARSLLGDPRTAHGGPGVDRSGPADRRRRSSDPRPSRAPGRQSPISLRRRSRI